MAIGTAARFWLAAAGLSGAGGVALAAAAAHRGLAHASLTERAAEFMLMHAAGLIACAWLADRRGGALPNVAGLAFMAGLLLFSGTLALRAAGADIPVGAAPVGGLALIAGWLALAGSAMQSGRSRAERG